MPAPSRAGRGPRITTRIADLPAWAGTRSRVGPRPSPVASGGVRLGRRLQLRRSADTGRARAEPIGCNMSMRRTVLYAVGGFRHEVGRVGSTPSAVRRPNSASASGPPGLDATAVRPRDAGRAPCVSDDRATSAVLPLAVLPRGLSKGCLRSDRAGDALSSERTYTARVLPRAVVTRDASRRGTAGWPGPVP